MAFVFIIALLFSLLSIGHIFVHIYYLLSTDISPTFCLAAILLMSDIFSIVICILFILHDILAVTDYYVTLFPLECSGGGFCHQDCRKSLVPDYDLR